MTQFQEGEIGGLLVLAFGAAGCMAVLATSYVVEGRSRDPNWQMLGVLFAGMMLWLLDACLSGFSPGYCERILTFIIYALHPVLVLVFVDALIIKFKRKAHC